MIKRDHGHHNAMSLTVLDDPMSSLTLESGHLQSVTPPLDLDLLRDRDYTIILGKTTRSYEVPQLSEAWDKAQATIKSVIQLCESLDQDGLTLYTAESRLGARTGSEGGFKKSVNLKSQELSAAIEASCPPQLLECGLPLQEALRDYFDRKTQGLTQANGEIILVFLDGEPADRWPMVRAIVDATRWIDRPDELAIGIVQIGNDSLATGFFQALDDDLYLAGAKTDIVDFEPITHVDVAALSQFLRKVLAD
jgi:hypothetical protein